MNSKLSLNAVSQALSRAFPDLGPVAPLRMLGEGFSSIALETAGGIVVRIARNAQAGAKYSREARLLPQIKRFLPVAIPDPQWHVKSSPEFPHGVIGYRTLRGEPLDPKQMSESALREVAAQLGRIVHALQRIPLKFPPPGYDPRARAAEWQRMRDVSSPALRNELMMDEYLKVHMWWDSFLADARMHEFTPVLLHGDLWYGNMLVEGGRITGLIDFEQAGPGDPAQDFVPQLYLGQQFLDWTLEAFQKAGGAVDENFHHRLRHLWALREFDGLVYALEQDPGEFNDAVEKIRRGPILSPRGLDGWGGL